MGRTVRFPTAYAWACERNARVDEWRAERRAERHRLALEVHREMLRRWDEERWSRSAGLDVVMEVLARCPVRGADEMAAWLRTGESPAGDDPARTAWDKRIQRVRAWVAPRVGRWIAENCLKRRADPPRPTFRQAVREVVRDERETAA